MASATQVKVFRWAMALSPYNLHIKHISGASNKVADLLSRLVTFPADEEEEENFLVPKRTQKNDKIVWLEREEERVFLPRMPTLEEFEAMEEEIQPEDIRWIYKGQGQLWYHTRTHKLYVPPRIREALIFFHHSGKFGGHQGINRTAARLRNCVRWSSLQNDVEEYVNSCGGVGGLGWAKDGARNFPPNTQFLRRLLIHRRRRPYKPSWWTWLGQGWWGLLPAIIGS
eukprot:GHVS01001926.1.p1 GENE.GHVS01001926.1~~GHVS01001926.1.p1  ORF type:complete len:227 (-),score=19.06 GHVS01001926.1:927-1607(-)